MFYFLRDDTGGARTQGTGARHNRSAGDNGVAAMTGTREDTHDGTEQGGGREPWRSRRFEPPVIEGRTIRATAAPYRWVCPCKEPPVLLATYDLVGRLNIKVRDRYWHLFGFGHVQAICPRCGAEHLLDLRALKKQTERDRAARDDVTE